MKHGFVILSVLAFAMAAADPLEAAAPEAALTPAQFQKRLEKPVGIAWKGRVLRDAIDRLAETYRFQAILDRRVDPGQSIDLSVNNESLAVALAKLADSAGLEHSVIGTVVYFGPPETAAVLRTLIELRTNEIRELPTASRTRLLGTRTSGWQRLCPPKKLLADLEREYGITISNLDYLPHDLWPAAELPPLSLAERLSLIAAGFHLTFRVDDDGKTIALTRIPEEVSIERRYRGYGRSAILARRWTELVPNASVQPQGGFVVVRGRAEDHAVLAADKRRGSTSTQKPKTPKNSRHVFTLTVKEAPLAAVLKTFAKQLKISFEFDNAAINAAGIDMRQLVVVDVKNASLDELLDATLKGTGLTYERDETEIVILPAPPFQ